MNALRYSVQEALTSLWRGRHSGLLSTGTIAVALLVLGGFLLATSNLQRLGDEWSRATEMSVYLDDNATPAERSGVEALLKPSAIVAAYDFVSKDAALDRFKQTFADLASTIGTFEGNPLPSSYEVRLQGTDVRSAAVEALASTLRGAPGVTDVRYDRQWLDRLQSAVGLVRMIGFGLGAVLVVGAALTVATVVRLALHARQDELEIMELVGAPAVYVRGPFVVEGILQGGLGALVALAALGAIYVSLRARYLTPLAAAISLSEVRFLSPLWCLLLLAGGMVVGCLGGMLASRRG